MEKIPTTPEIRKYLEEFYDRVFKDLMIGYLFEDKDRDRLIEKETELTLQMFDGSSPYTGRSMDRVHRPLNIFVGHFNRRQQILRETLLDLGAPADMVQSWMEHGEGLRDQIIAKKC